MIGTGGEVGAWSDPAPIRVGWYFIVTSEDRAGIILVILHFLCPGRLTFNGVFCLCSLGPESRASDATAP
jgi:hypothetical protein